MKRKIKKSWKRLRPYPKGITLNRGFLGWSGVDIRQVIDPDYPIGKVEPITINAGRAVGKSISQTLQSAMVKPLKKEKK